MCIKAYKHPSNRLATKNLVAAASLACHVRADAFSLVFVSLAALEKSEKAPDIAGYGQFHQM